MIYGIEFTLIVVSLVQAFACPRLGSRWFESVERAFGKLAARPRLAVLVTGLTALAARATLLPILPIPEPALHDEFCYLLAADTFAHGRLANPTHPMWMHFDTFYVLWHPTYASMFPPAQGLVMALGQVLLGHPFWGVWLSCGLMCSALTWMLQGWMPPKWAVLGGLLAVIRLATFSYWANSYWGGAVAATGGALVFGALPRLKRSLSVVDALLLGLGLAILANSRPYEGLIFSLPVVAALLVWTLGKEHPPYRTTLRRLVLPVGVILGIVSVLMGYYFWRVTGSPWRMGHQAYDATHLVNPYFLWQTPRHVAAFHNDAIQGFYLTRELPYWQQIHSLGGLLRLECTRLVEIWMFYFLPLFTLPLFVTSAALPFGFSWRQISKSTRFLLLAAGFGLAGYSLEVYFNPHYFAPGTCLVYALVLGAMRYARGWTWRQKPVGLAITRAIPLMAGVLFVLCVAYGPALRPFQPGVFTWCSPSSSSLMKDRARILSELDQQPGRHLVIVRYSASHQFGLEWVFNRADIDTSKVVWAHDLGQKQNAELLKYFQGRRIWIVEPDISPARLSAYPAE
jgi:hypothetical protein